MYKWEKNVKFFLSYSDCEKGLQGNENFEPDFKKTIKDIIIKVLPIYSFSSEGCS